MRKKLFNYKFNFFICLIFFVKPVEEKKEEKNIEELIQKEQQQRHRDLQKSYETERAIYLANQKVYIYSYVNVYYIF